MKKLTIAASFAAALGISGCDNGREPVNHHADPQAEVNPNVSWIQANLRLAREKCAGNRAINARTALDDAILVRSTNDDNLSPAEKAQLDADITATRIAIALCLGTPVPNTHNNL